MVVVSISLPYFSSNPCLLFHPYIHTLIYPQNNQLQIIYIKIKDVDEPEAKKKSTTGLEDSDEDDDDDDDDDDAPSKKKKKLKRIRDMDVLDEDDLDLINEARGLPTKSQQQLHDEEIAAKEKASKERGASFVKGRNEQELSRGLFTGDTDDEDDDGEGGGGENGNKKKKSQKNNSQSQQLSQPERYDEDGLDDFIEDDVDGGSGYANRADGDDVMATGVGSHGVSESMLQEHLDIFGTDYMDFMEGNKDDDDDKDDEYDPDGVAGVKKRNRRRRKKMNNKYRERGVGVDYGMDSDEEINEDDDSLDIDDESDDDDDSDDDADLFGDDDMDQDLDDKERAEVLKLKREKKKLAREERRKQRNERIEAKRKAQLRRAFEPVQLVENFCTERDDAIRIIDSPERYYDWLESSPSTKVLPKMTDEITEEEDEESFWIMQKIPPIQSEWASASNTLVTPTTEQQQQADNNNNEAIIEQKERAVLTSIIYALRYMRIEKLEPEFIRRYRKDVVTSPAVRANLYRIMDEDTEWERMTEARSKIESILTAESKGGSDENVGEELLTLKSQLKAATEKLDKTVNDEKRIKVELEDAEKALVDATAAVEGKTKVEDDDDNDDDDLFGDDEDEDKESVSYHT